MEGEGSFGFSKNGAGKQGRLIVQVNMTDRDVIERAASIMENAKVYEGRKRENRKQAFTVAITGYAAERIMKFLRPMLGVRRQAQIDASLEKWDRRPVKRREWSKLIPEHTKTL